MRKLIKIERHNDPASCAKKASKHPAARGKTQIRPLKLYMILLALSVLSLSGESHAQTESATEANERNAKATLEEVIVTAQRREQSAQDVAISITVFSGEEIANANMTNTSDLAQLTPSLSTNNRFGTENASFSIRGFTKALRTTASVGVFFAEVVAPRGQSSQTSGDGAGPGTLFDLQNVQVLKGPQGTLFGRNTTGGAILIEPQKPTDQFEGYVELSRGDFNLEQTQAVINLPLHNRVKLRLGVDNKQRDGFVDNITGIGADELSDVNYKAGRVSLVVDIADTIENYTIVNYADSETNGQTSRLFECNTETDPSKNPLLALTVPACQRQLENQRATGQDKFFDTVSTVGTPITLIEDLRVINKTTWDVTDFLRLKSIVAYSKLETENGSDVFGTQFTETQAALLGTGLPGGIADPKREFAPGTTSVAPGVPVTSQETWVGEFQVQGLSFDGRLDWQTGVYFENSQPDGFSGNNAAILVSCELPTLESANPDDFNCNDPLGGTLGGVSEPRLKTEFFNRAVYAQASYEIFEWLGITGGVRYTWDDTRGETVFTLHKFVGTQRQEPIVSEETATQSSEAPTGMLELQYKPFRDVMVYGKVVRGYRQGSVNMSADAGIQVHEEETVDTFEIGAKTSFEWPLPGRFNISVFDNDLKDMQLQTGYISPNKGPTTAIFNAGSAEIRGLEASAFFQLYEGLTLNLSFSRLMTELLEQEDTCAKIEAAAGFIGGATCSPTADIGETLPFAQDKGGTASLNYRLPLSPAIGEIEIGTTYAYTGEQRATGGSSSPNDILDSFTVWNLNLGWRNILDSALDLSLFATNVTDEENVIHLTGTFNGLGFDSRQMAPPRMYGARLRYNFGQ